MRHQKKTSDLPPKIEINLSKIGTTDKSRTTRDIRLPPKIDEKFLKGLSITEKEYRKLEEAAEKESPLLDVWIPLAIDVALTLPIFGPLGSIGGAIASKLPLIGKVITPIARAFTPVIGTTALTEIRRQIFPISKKEKEAVENEEFIKRLGKEAVWSVVGYTAFSIPMYGLKYVARGAGKAISTTGLKKSLQNAYEKAIDKIFFSNVSKRTREFLAKKFSPIILKTDIAKSIAYEHLTPIIRHPEFKRYADSIWDDARKKVKDLVESQAVEAGLGIAPIEKYLRKYELFEAFMNANRKFAQTGGLYDAVALERLFIDYHKGIPIPEELRKLLDKMFSDPDVAKIMRGKVESFVNNYRVLLRKKVVDMHNDAQEYYKRLQEQERIKSLIEEMFDTFREKMGTYTRQLQSGVDVDAVTKMIEEDIREKVSKYAGQIQEKTGARIKTIVDKMVSDLTQGIKKHTKQLRSGADIESIMKKVTSDVEKGLKKYVKQLRKDIKAIKPRGLNVFLNAVDMSLDDFVKSDPKDVANRLLEKMRDDIENYGRSYFVRSVFNLPAPTKPIRVMLQEFLERASGAAQFGYILDLSPTSHVFDAQKFLATYRVFKRRYYPTIIERIADYFIREDPEVLLRKNIEEILSVADFKRGYDVFSWFATSTTLPMSVRAVREVLKELARRKEYVFLSKLSVIAPEARFLAKGKFYRRVPYGDIIVDIEENFKTLLDTIATRSAGLEHEAIMAGGGVDAFTKINSLLKSWLLKWSPFHTLVLSRNMAAVGLGGKEFGEAFGAAIHSIFHKEPPDFLLTKLKVVYRALEELSEKGYDVIFPISAFGGEKSPLTKLVFGGKLYNMFIKLKGSSMDEYSRVKMFVAAKKLRDRIADLFDFDARFLWNGFYTSAKVSTAYKLVEAWKKGIINDEQLAKSIQAINDIFGGAPEWYFIPHSVAQKIRFILFAPDWYLSLWRNFSTWIKGDVPLTSDFFPTLMRFNLVLADRIHKVFTGEGIFERMEKDGWGLKDIVLNWDQVTKIKIPITDAAGHKRVLEIDTAGIDFEPLEMVGLLEFIHNAVRATHEVGAGYPIGIAMYSMFAGTLKDWLNYWWNKRGSLLKVLGDLGTISFAFRTGDEKKFAELVQHRIFLKYIFPLSLIQLFPEAPTEKFITTPEFRYILKSISILPVLSIKLDVHNTFADYIAKNIHNAAIGAEYERIRQWSKNLDTLIKHGLEEAGFKARRNMVYNLDDSIAHKLISRFIYSSIEDVIDMVNSDKLSLQEAGEIINREIIPKAVVIVDEMVANSTLPMYAKRNIMARARQVARKIARDIVRRKMRQLIQEE